MENNLLQTKSKLSLKDKFKTIISIFGNLTFSQGISVLSLLLLAVSLPIGILLTLNPLKPIITPASGPITPVNSPTPIVIGNLPVIITEALPSASVNKVYRARLEGYDLDPEDVLTFRVTNVPTGLVLTNCKQNMRNIKEANLRVKYLSCEITGKTRETGLFEAMVILSDSRNNTVKYFSLNVTN